MLDLVRLDLPRLLPQGNTDSSNLLARRLVYGTVPPAPRLVAAAAVNATGFLLLCTVLRVVRARAVPTSRL